MTDYEELKQGDIEASALVDEKGFVRFRIRALDPSGKEHEDVAIALLSDLSSLKARCEAAEARFQRALPTAMYVLRSEAVSAMRLALAQPAEGESKVDPDGIDWKEGERWRMVGNTKVYRSYEDYCDV